ncbi:contactin-associated protein-like 2 isoform X2 [Anneissia japonica]|uniref:contactin-associated protein-like 2 isoform X2 n=1 Tax=Anneissia japonica TaxID=1529436 RepID=UPI0014255E88|nr:contactin-associated protein-like 2 isoform X2 [Anneissia japonica]
MEVELAKNCEELRYFGFGSDNATFFFIDPDGGNQGVDPFQVECEITDGSFTGRTIVTPTINLVEDVNGYESSGSFIRYITYAISIDQIVALMTSSVTCRQYVKYECFGSLLRYTYWVSRNGTVMRNWGSPTGYDGCLCGYRGACYSASVVCNCNENDNVLRVDDGYIDDISTLPVIRLHHGDTGHANEYGLKVQVAAHFQVMQLYGNVCLSGYVLATYSVASIIKCVASCQKHELCQSLSVISINDGNTMMRCTLNYRSARVVPNNQLTVDSECKHFEFF